MITLDLKHYNWSKLCLSLLVLIIFGTVRGQNMSMSSADRQYQIAINSLPNYAGTYRGEDGTLRIMLVNSSNFGTLSIDGRGKSAQINLTNFQRSIVSQALSPVLRPNIVGRGVTAEILRPETFIAVPAKYTYVQITNWKAQIREKLRIGIISLDLNIPENQVVVGVSNINQIDLITKLLLSENIPQDAFIVKHVLITSIGGGGGTSTPNLYPCVDLQDSCRPLKGGLGLQMGWTTCSAGLFARRYDGTIGLLTNMHCVDALQWNTTGDQVWQVVQDTDHLIGSVTRKSGIDFSCPSRSTLYNGVSYNTIGCMRSDSVFIQLSTSNYAIGSYANVPEAQLSPVATNNYVGVYSPRINDQVFRVGKASGKRYGNVSTETAEYALLIGGSDNRGQFYWYSDITCAKSFDLGAIKGGDSGGPVLYYLPINGNVYATGLVHTRRTYDNNGNGIEDSGDQVEFCWDSIFKIENKLQVEIAW